MADSKLLSSVMRMRKNNRSDEEVREQMQKEGWTIEDINGALALCKLSDIAGPGRKEIPQLSELRSGKIFQKTSAGSGFRIAFYLAAFLVALVFIDWNGYAIPPLHQYQLKEYVTGAASALHVMDATQVPS